MCGEIYTPGSGSVVADQKSKTQAISKKYPRKAGLPAKETVKMIINNY